jgi:ferredoxin-thioredoxin reductase catalytic chain
MKQPTEASLARVRKLVESYCKKSGTVTHPENAVTESVVLGLARNLDDLGRPACDDMQIYKYCHCLLFVNEQGQPITEYLPEGHEGRAIHGLVPDPTPAQGRPLRDKAEEREKERRERPS